jgi:integrase
VLVCLGVGGLRAGEVAGLRVGDVEITPARVVLRVLGKSNKRRVVALGGRDASALRAWAKARGEAAPNEPWLLARRPVDGQPPRGLNVAGIDYVVRKHARVAGLPGVHAHSLRHSAASLALSHGASLVDVREMLGHSSVVTTSRYLHLVVVEHAARRSAML